MASIHVESPVAVSADTAWKALRQIGAADKLFAPVLDGAALEGDTRTLDGPGLTYHHASMQIVEDGPHRCRFVWTTDFLPAESAASLRPLIEAGTRALKTNLEAANGRPAAAS